MTRVLHADSWLQKERDTVKQCIDTSTFARNLFALISVLVKYGNTSYILLNFSATEYETISIVKDILITSTDIAWYHLVDFCNIVMKQMARRIHVM